MWVVGPFEVVTLAPLRSLLLRSEEKRLLAADLTLADKEYTPFHL